MPYTEVMHKFKHGMLHSGSKHGKTVKNRKQAIAIMLSEKRAAEGGKKEYQSGVGPSRKASEEMVHSSSKRKR